MTISELATAATTSETTVLRFSKRLGLSGYPRLRLALAEASAHPRALAASQTDISAADSIDDVVRKIALADASAVEETAQQLDRDTLAQTAKTIDRAVRVDVYGYGASALVAADLQQKLHRIGCLAFAWNDPHLALTSAALLGPRDIAIGISHSGTTRETIESIVTAKANGARTVAITNFPLSPLAQAADLVLTTAARETALRSGATASRIAALTVVDCLYIVVAQRNLRSTRKAVKSTRDAVSSHHVVNDSHH
jgi:DNA-binding MurR/RpiR family transcriptional regulator